MSTLLLFLSLMLLAVTLSSAAELRPDVEKRLASAAREHPRLFFRDADIAPLRQRLLADPLLSKALKEFVTGAEAQLDAPPVERALTGRRLLGQSRTCLARVTHWALAARLTGDKRFVARAQREMLAAATFTDWNPSHFLDVAEMTAALAIGYDWLYAELDAEARATIRKAIVELGLKPGIAPAWWVSGNNNWNQVCHAGLCLGAIAVCEDEPDLAADLVVRAVQNVPRAMAEYSPDGAYPEGPTYWGYGTSFNVLLIAAFESALGTDFGLASQPGFLASADYYLHAIGPTGLFFNYSDCGLVHGITPAMYWFARRRQDPSLLWFEQPRLERMLAAARARGTPKDRLHPFLLLWANPSVSAQAPAASHWVGRGTTPVAMHRSGWEDDATFVAVKAGSPSANHAHMDVGSFVMDALGKRWAEDLGAQDYHSLESRGVDLWNNKQDSQRWRVFRIGVSSHNTLRVDGEAQCVSGKAPILSSTPERTVIDLGPVYAGQLDRATRGMRLNADRSVLVQDEITAGPRDATVRWAMVTRARVETHGSSATLERDGKKLILRVLSPAQAELRVYPTDPPPADYDARNEGTCMLGFEVRVAAAGQERLSVLLAPADSPAARQELTPLTEW